MKTVMIYAYTANNVGDDLFIYLLCKRYPDTQFILYAPKIYKKTFNNLDNLTIFATNTIPYILKRTFYKISQRPYKLRENIAKRSDLAVYIGGSLFIEHENWKEEVKNVLSMLKGRTPFFIIGANFGPYVSERFYNVYHTIFTKCTDICFRDQQSYNLFKHLPNVRLASDLVFQLDVNIEITEKKYIVISVIYPSIRKNLKHVDESYFKKLKELTITYIKNGYDVWLIGFCKREQDHLAIEKIVSIIPEMYYENIRTYTYDADINEILEILANSTAIVASRFHAMILSFILQKPTFPIIYNEKMTTVLDDLSFTGNRWNLIHSEPLQVDDFLQFNTNKAPMISNEINCSKEQFKVLDHFLEEKGNV